MKNISLMKLRLWQLTRVIIADKSHSGSFPLLWRDLNYVIGQELYVQIYAQDKFKWEVYLQVVKKYLSKGETVHVILSPFSVLCVEYNWIFCINEMSLIQKHSVTIFDVSRIQLTYFLLLYYIIQKFVTYF